MSKRNWKWLSLVMVVALVFGIAGYAPDSAFAQTGRTRVGWLIADKITVNSDTDIVDDLTVGADATVGGAIVQTINTSENRGLLPTVASAAIIHTTAGALFTIADGEIWIIHGVLVRVTSNFNCTGDDCTMTIGDGGDVDGLVVLTDAEMQAAAVDVAGGVAGVQGYMSDTLGAYMADSQNFMYAPVGAAETIDIVIGGTAPAAGAGTVYIIYTRIL